MTTSAVRVLAELLAQIEDEWSALEGNRPGSCYYVAQKLIEHGLVTEGALVLKPGETLILRVPATTRPDALHEMKAKLDARGIASLIISGDIGIRADGEKPQGVVLSAEAWSYVRESLTAFLRHDCAEPGVGDYELRYGGTQLRDAIASMTEQTAACRPEPSTAK